MGNISKSLSRRQLLKGGAIAGAGLFAPWNLASSKSSAKGLLDVGLQQTTGDVHSLAYGGPLPASVVDLGGSNLFYTAELISAIPVAKPKAKVGGKNFYEISMKQGSFPFFGNKSTPTWGYDDGMGGYIGYLGPTIEVKQGENIQVNWINKLPGNIDDPLGFADPNLIPEGLRTIGGRAVVHVHGGHNPEIFDGGPENSFPPGQSRVYFYDNDQDEASMWYHDHAWGVTRLNAYAGLAGLYIIRGAGESSLKLPSGEYEIPLILQDKAFFLDGGNVKLWYYKPWNMEFFGNINLVNAKPWPVLHVEPRRYRFRIYNATQARFYNLRLTTDAPPSGPGTWNRSLAAPFYQIGAEGGFMPKVGVVQDLLVGNGERADVIVDFSNLKNRTVYLSNDASIPYDPGVPLDPNETAETNTLFPAEPVVNMMQVMKFIVDKPLKAIDRSFVALSGKKVNPDFKALDQKNASQWRQITLVEQPYPFGDVNGQPGNMVTVNNRMFSSTGITEKPKLGSTEVWQFINLTPDWHPMHLHLVTFQVLGRQQLKLNPDFDESQDPEKLRYLYGLAGGGSQLSPSGSLLKAPYAQFLIPGTWTGPGTNETGFKDTVKCPNGYVTFVIAKFTDYLGKFVYHCHILDHEENDMMQYMQVVPPFAKESAEEEVPSQFALDQNYPNPFNPETTIRFHVPQIARVQLKVFNSIGQEVATLAEGEYPAGAHLVTFDAHNLASGVYYAKIQTGGFTAIRKMMLVR